MTDKKYITLIDKEGLEVEVDDTQILKKISENLLTIMGFSLECIIELRRQYLIRHGTKPPTVESIRKVFETKIITHGLLSGQALCGIKGLPYEWPNGHKWVYAFNITEITCSKCLEIANKK